jgi:hypothetical protein
MIKFELKKEHLLLLKNLSWTMSSDKIIMNVKNEADEIAPPFGFDSIYEAIDLFLNGKTKEVDPTNGEFSDYTKEQIEEWDKLYSELPTALEIILSSNGFELGEYKTKNSTREWKKIR